MTHHAIISDTKLLNISANMPGVNKIIDYSRHLGVQPTKVINNQLGGKLILQGKLNIMIIYEDETSAVKISNFSIPFISSMSDMIDRNIELEAKIEHFSIETINLYTLAISFIIFITPILEEDNLNDELCTIQNESCDSDTPCSERDNIEQNLLEETEDILQNNETTGQPQDGIESNNKCSFNTTIQPLANQDQELAEIIEIIDGQTDIIEEIYPDTESLSDPQFLDETKKKKKTNNVSQSRNNPYDVFLTSELYSVRKKKKRKPKGTSSVKKNKPQSISYTKVTPKETNLHSINHNELTPKKTISQSISYTELTPKKTNSHLSTTIPYKSLLNLKESKTTLSFKNLSDK